jgi:large subunit ribosomal protein L22
VKKVLQSAIANAENNHDLDVDDLVITEASVGKNLVMRRFYARARGRGAPVEKPFSQLTIVVEEKREEKPAKKEAPHKGEAKTETKGEAKASAKKPAAKKPAAKKAAPKRGKEKA